MSDAPERIYPFIDTMGAPLDEAPWNGQFFAMPGQIAPSSSLPPYIRYDLYAAALAERDALRAEVERLRGALQLYAGGVSDWGVNWEPIDDRGAVARAALEGNT